MDKRDLFLQELKKVWKDSQRMIDYCVKESAFLVELDDGDITSIKKPTIETSFCFGYGFCGVSTEEDENRAFDCARVARTQGDYFKQENLKGLDEWITLLESDDKMYKYTSYLGLTDEDKLKSIQAVRYYEMPPKGAKELTQAERKALLEGYKEVRVKFEKRLDTYLKRYGTSKLKVWTYLSD